MAGRKGDESRGSQLQHEMCSPEDIEVMSNEQPGGGWGEGSKAQGRLEKGAWEPLQGCHSGSG